VVLVSAVTTPESFHARKSAARHDDHPHGRQSGALNRSSRGQSVAVPGAVDFFSPAPKRPSELWLEISSFRLTPSAKWHGRHASRARRPLLSCVPGTRSSSAGTRAQRANLSTQPGSQTNELHSDTAEVWSGSSPPRCPQRDGKGVWGQRHGLSEWKHRRRQRSHGFRGGGQGPTNHPEADRPEKHRESADLVRGILFSRAPRRPSRDPSRCSHVEWGATRIQRNCRTCQEATHMASQTVPAGWELICRRRLEGLQAPTQAFGMDG
jgi:hypothetical protein